MAFRKNHQGRTNEQRKQIYRDLIKLGFRPDAAHRIRDWTTPKIQLVSRIKPKQFMLETK
ncbi:MAG TPA: hypothetical protein VI911_08520 [Patescibacteria group bacterium]|nr:hypothetical protein [Patescibacteria group bacterium]